MVTLSEGDINERHIRFKGTMEVLFLKDLAGKTCRGLRGRVEAGRSGGGKAPRAAITSGSSSSKIRKRAA